jgi:formylmethanofuran dehydrogenase subunit E-like metal-binding protein
VRPGRPAEPLYFAFLKKEGPDKLLMTYLTLGKDGLSASPALNIHFAPGVSLQQFAPALGPQTFNLVSLANGWAMGLPEDLMRGSLRHGHYCCGVFTGYFTARFIEKNMPVKPGQKLVYIGAPAWCQDDYLIDYLGLTPGTGGYMTMALPWWRSWKTKDRTYQNLGGVVVRWDDKAKNGEAWVLSFDWHYAEFRRFLGRPDAKLDWKGQPWLHMAYNRFFLSKLDDPGYFVSILKSKKIEGQEEYNRITAMGANPLDAILGEDPTWPADFGRPPQL